jgi:hypothetical protein
MERLIPFGKALVDPALIAWVGTARDRHAEPAPGQSRIEGEYGFEAMHVVTLALTFDHAAPIYNSLGYNNLDGAASVARDLVQAAGGTFVAADENLWVRPAFVGSITYNHHEVTLWLNLPAAAPSFNLPAKDSADAQRIANRIASYVSAGTGPGR